MDRSEPVTFHEKDVGSAKVFSVQGPLDCHHIKEFSQLAEIIKTAGVQRVVVLDMSGVRYVDSVGLGTLISIRTTTARQKGHFRLCGLQEFVQNLIQTTHLDRALDIYPTVDDALKTPRPSG